jgi:hypothetical protein
MDRDRNVMVAWRGRAPRISDDGSRVLYHHNGTYPNYLTVLTAGDASGDRTDDDVLWETDTTGALRAANDEVPGTRDAWYANHELSGDGTVLAYQEGWWTRTATGTDTGWRLKVREIATGRTEDLGELVEPLRMNQPYDSMWPPALSRDGGTIAWSVVGRERDVAYVQEWRAGKAREEVAASTKVQRLDQVEMSADGRHVVYALTDPGPNQPADDGWHWDRNERYPDSLGYRMNSICWEDSGDQIASQLHRHDRRTGLSQRITVAADGGPAVHSCGPDLSDDGTTVTFVSEARDLVAGVVEPRGQWSEFDWDVFAAKAPIAADPVTWPAGASLRAVDVSSTTLRLTWDAAKAGGPAVTGYRVYLDGTLLQEVSASARSYVASGLEPATDHAFAVEAVDAAGTTTPRLTTTARTLEGQQPGGTAPLQLAAEPGGVVRLAWDPAPGATGYQVLRSTGTGPAEVVALPADSRAHVDRGLPAETTYRYQVLAVSGGAPVPHTVEREVAVGPVTAQSVTVEVPTTSGGRAIPMQSEAVVTLRGEPNRTGTASITRTSWYDGPNELPAPVTTSSDVPLAEKAPGVYTATVALADGTAELSSVTALLDDGAGHRSAPSAPPGCRCRSPPAWTSPWRPTPTASRAAGSSRGARRCAPARSSRSQVGARSAWPCRRPTTTSCGSSAATAATARSPSGCRSSLAWSAPRCCARSWPRRSRSCWSTPQASA